MTDPQTKSRFTRPHFSRRRGTRDWSKVEIEGRAATVDRLSYCGGDSDEGCEFSVLPNPWCGPETTCEETSGTHGVACISGSNRPVVGSVGFGGVQEKDDMNKDERNANAGNHAQRTSLKSKLEVRRASTVMG